MLSLDTPITMFHKIYELKASELITLTKVYNYLFKDFNIECSQFTSSDNLINSVDILTLSQKDGNDVVFVHWYELVFNIILPKFAELLNCRSYYELSLTRDIPEDFSDLIIWIEELYLEVKHT